MLKNLILCDSQGFFRDPLSQVSNQVDCQIYSEFWKTFNFIDFWVYE